MAAQSYAVEYTDTFHGEPNYSWVRRHTVTVPELTHYGYTGSTDGSYHEANKRQRRVLMTRAKASVGLAGVRGVTYDHGGALEFRPYGMCTVLFVTYQESTT
jgi:hypothetical protein